MKCVGHPSNTRPLDPPAGWDHDRLPVDPVMVTDVAIGKDVMGIATFWKPDPVELSALLLGGTVMLSVIGPGMPPVALQVATATEPHEPAGEPTDEQLHELARVCAVPGHATMINHLAFGRLVLARHARRAMENAYARRYRYLRERPLDSIKAGGIFVGRTPENQVINGLDLDRDVDERIAAEWPAAPALRFGVDREALRQDLGEALATVLASLCEDGVAPDWFDSRNVDVVLDELLPVIRTHVDPEMVNAAWSAADPAPAGGDARCMACGCTDSQACPGGCSWAWVDRETQRGLCSACVVADLAERVNRAGELTVARPTVIPSLRACCHEPASAPGFDPARAINGELRAEMLDMLRCMARGDLAERVKDEPLKKILGAIFTELSEADSDAQEAPKLRERIEALQAELAAAADAPRQVAALNERLIAANAQVDALRLQLAKGGAA